MVKLNPLFMMAAAMVASYPNEIYYPRDFNTDQYRLRVNRNNYKANEKAHDKILREYKIKGKTIMAYSKKDAIKRLKHYK